MPSRFQIYRARKPQPTSKTILLGGRDWSLTAREVIFAFFLTGILSVIGWCIADTIERRVHSKKLMYKQAVQIESNADQLEWALSTDIGHAFIEGSLEAIDTVSHEHLAGKWLEIYAVHQRYTMHTRLKTYTVTDAKGKSHVRTKTETYWSWDTVDTECLRSKKVKFLGIEFLNSVFAYPRSSFDKHEVVKTGINKRIVFDALSPSIVGSVFAELKDHTIANGPVEFCRDAKLQDMYKSMTTSYALPIFWTSWIILMALALGAFFAIENDWLEDNS